MFGNRLRVERLCWVFFIYYIISYFEVLFFLNNKYFWGIKGFLEGDVRRLKIEKILKGLIL